MSNKNSDDRDETPDRSANEPELKLPKAKRPIMVKIDDIVLGNAGRRLDDRKTRQLECSISDQGLRTPIQIFHLKGVHKGRFGLAAGQHRLQAVKNLG